LSVERLEDKMLLAGDVTVSLAGDAIHVSDGATAQSEEASFVRITESLDGIGQSVFRIEGLTSSGTTVNGQAYVEVLKAGVVDMVFSHEGTAILLDFSLPGNLEFFDTPNGGAANVRQSISINRVTLGGSVIADTGNGEDVLTLRDSHVFGDVTVAMGNGTDTLNIIQSSNLLGFDMQIDGQVHADMGSSWDSVTIEDRSTDHRLVISGPVEINMGQNGLLGGTNPERVLVENAVLQSDLTVYCDQGVDSMSLTGNAIIGGDVLLVGGQGQDILAIDTTVSVLGTLTIESFETIS
jgi:hypothetical protein